jgi:hypothetical protein
MSRHIPLIFLLIFFTIQSCKKEYFINDASDFVLSTDSIKFDTVFTSAGSVTKLFVIKNPRNTTLRISNIQLMGGNASIFKMNVDGSPGTKFANLEIEGNDSLYVFISANVNPNADKLPFIIRDSIQISANGKNVFQQLEAWGQNARYIKSQYIVNDTTWDKELPYVILGGVLVDTFATLRIEPGTRIYLNANAPMIIDGSLIAKGNKKDSIVFQGNRLDEPYRNYPGSWPGIIFRESSKNNVIEYGIIKNAYQGIIADQHKDAEPKVTINNTIIDNIYDIGVLGINSNIIVNNCLISNCGTNVALIYGGKYSFTHCTLATIANDFIAHKTPVLSTANFVKQNNQIFSAPLNANFTNCIIWGSEGIVDDEIVLEKQGAGDVNMVFDHVLFRAKKDPQNSTFKNVVRNENPAFDSIDIANNFYDFRLKKNSPAVNRGGITDLFLDLNGLPRKGLPDIGCYENQED